MFHWLWTSLPEEFASKRRCHYILCTAPSHRSYTNMSSVSFCSPSLFSWSFTDSITWLPWVKVLRFTGQWRQRSKAQTPQLRRPGMNFVESEFPRGGLVFLSSFQKKKWRSPTVGSGSGVCVCPPVGTVAWAPGRAPGPEPSVSKPWRPRDVRSPATGKSNLEVSPTTTVLPIWSSTRG